MRSAFVISTVVCLGFAAVAPAADVRITCAPGLNIFLNGDFQGVSIPKDDGKFLTGLSEGEHTITVKKTGFVTREFTVVAGPIPVQAVAGELQPSIDIDHPETQAHDVVGRPEGTLEITSNPRDCTIDIAGQKIWKQEPKLVFPRFPAGDYEARLEHAGTVLETKLSVREAKTITIRADFPENRLDVVGDESAEKNNASGKGTGGSAAKSGCIEYWVEVLRTSNPDDLEVARPALKKMGFPLEHQKLITIEDDGTLPLYKLRIGPVPHKKDAKMITSQMKNTGFKGAWMIPSECQ